jgi:hypothetical protein
MPEGGEGKPLLEPLADLIDEVRQGARGRHPQGQLLVRAGRPQASLGPEDEQLVVRLRAALAKLATAAASGTGARVAGLRVAQMRLDAAEALMRRKLMIGQGERLPQLLPSFVFLAMLPLLGRTDALRVSARAAELLEGGA